MTEGHITIIDDNGYHRVTKVSLYSLEDLSTPLKSAYSYGYNCCGWPHSANFAFDTESSWDPNAQWTYPNHVLPGTYRLRIDNKYVILTIVQSYCEDFFLKYQYGVFTVIIINNPQLVQVSETKDWDINFTFEQKMEDGQTDVGTVSGAVSLSAIYGFGPNDIYAVGESIYENPTPPPNFLDSSLIIRFDGVQWREVPIQRGRHLQTVHGDRPDNVWAGGVYGTAYLYDGVRCTRINSESNIWFKDIEATSIQVYGLAYTPNPGNYTVHYLLKPDSNTWAVVDSFTEVSIASAKFGHEDLRMIGGTLYSVGFGVFRKDGVSWTKLLETNTLLSIYGTRKEHIFAVGNLLTVWHFNGNNWAKLIVPGNPTWLLTSAWCNENEVFVVANDGYKTFILHGK